MGLIAVLAGMADIAVLGHANQPQLLGPLIDELHPDVVLLGFEPPTAALSLITSLPACRTLLLTWSRRRNDLLAAVRAAAAGLFYRDADDAVLLEAIRTVATGRRAFPACWEGAILDAVSLRDTPASREGGSCLLTNRERQVVQLILNGCSNKEVARVLDIAPQTVKNDVHLGMRKVGVTSRTRLSAWALGHGFVPGAVSERCS